ncbi:MULTISPECIES: AI-2E family transporter [unclassified Shewanella]|uniref:AI-2E family transporter n=1 Tax=unclassified Shewanella TaxID=196818 RepID=UPI000C835A54|nr:MULTISPECIES: AI-2E family transporter [unclassified Shewanella]MDO6619278.1 AI-2E family transporter [Shewanella sp. 6_MG-2023]MDO6678938.1 AI-2E family transporter [Shewanella sp. 4_MG-2023]MDO6776115.1 AI-2E family transporter [Shewanella sp. 3_MG-2023]PMG28709.1 AI-2E family transporter [Shewanella sp. 10N.286.52.C2]PMH87674.1 AI-2E family transporter [Shewanella sp. 10N.286.48.B5]
MLSFLGDWYKARFSDPHAITLLFILLGIGLLIYFAGGLLAPLFVALILAFLLEWPVAQIAKFGINRTVGASLILVLFVGLMVLVAFGLIPSLWRQGVALATDLPIMIDTGMQSLKALTVDYPQYVSIEQIDAMVIELKKLVDTQHLFDIGKQLLGYSASLLVLMVYVILVPLLVFFFLKDKDQLLKSSKRFFPNNRDLARKVWFEMDQQIFNYIRGKVIEIVIIGTVSYVFFAIMGLRYSALLGVLTGLSVLIPYVGATLVTLPIALVAFVQWGVSPEFGYVMIGYGIIQALDGNVLVPILFSDAVDLHPVMIIAAVLVFGGLWGVWGVFFAIPLASLVKAVINAWPNSSNQNNSLALDKETSSVSKS